MYTCYVIMVIDTNRQKLTDITLYPRLESVRTCLKNTSAVPLAGGKQTKGQRTLRGPASYSNHSFSSELSTTIYKGTKLTFSVQLDPFNLFLPKSDTYRFYAV